MKLLEKPLIWLSALIGRWAFKVLSGVFLAAGINQDSLEAYIYSVLSFLVGVLITFIQNKYLKNYWYWNNHRE